MFREDQGWSIARAGVLRSLASEAARERSGKRAARERMRARSLGRSRLLYAARSPSATAPRRSLVRSCPGRWCFARSPARLIPEAFSVARPPARALAHNEPGYTAQGGQRYATI